ncbi:hypothetical protein V8G54_000246 (mitochondrion) [Vigna mungo]|uniref:ATP synthase subunit a n=1 Tax=Vigna mungo TaxID=3915 RepID=A0AAQ3PDG6_VIGMU
MSSYFIPCSINNTLLRSSPYQSSISAPYSNNFSLPALTRPLSPIEIRLAYSETVWGTCLPFFPLGKELRKTMNAFDATSRAGGSRLRNRILFPFSSSAHRIVQPRKNLISHSGSFDIQLEWYFTLRLFLPIAPCDAGDSLSSPLDQFEIIPLMDMKIGDLYFSFTNPSLFMLLTLSLVLLLFHFVTKNGGGKSVPNAWQSLVELIYDFVPNLGMIPYSFTVTSHFLITLGVPLPLAPFLVLLELIPHCFRALSSGIRLFANMMAGDLGPLFIVLALTGPELGVAISQAHVSTISICIYLNDATNLHQTG